MYARNLMVGAVSALAAFLPSSALGQVRKVRVVSTDNEPIVYAYVTVEGGTGQITDDRGEVSLGAGKKRTLTVDVRRIGYTPWHGKLDLPDTAAVLAVALSPIAQTLV
jgi:hypothetical protein